MASPKALVESDDRRIEHAALTRAANDGADEPTGFIRVNGKPMAIWLPDGVTPASIGLKSFRPTRRIVS